MTRLRSNTRDLTPLYVALAIGAATYLIGCHLARAATLAATTQQTAPGIDWSFWTGAALAVATAGSYVLHALAARRHSATLEAVATEIDAVRALATSTKPLIASVPRDSQAGGAS